ncbi:hypothetical protein EFW57_01343 [Bacillus velezensis]|nr:hypothetical protein EFW57_01343 [Bacillus velezensis]
MSFIGNSGEVFNLNTKKEPDSNMVLFVLVTEWVFNDI